MTRDAYRLLGAIHLQPAAKAAADQMVVDDDLLERQLTGLRGNDLGASENLRAHPDLATVRANMNGTVHRLHRRMREEWQAVFGIDALAVAQGLVGITQRLGNGASSQARRCGLLPHLR